MDAFNYDTHEKIKTLQEQEQLMPKSQNMEIDTGQTWIYPIPGDEFRVKHIEKETAIKHALKKYALLQKLQRTSLLSSFRHRSF